MSINLENKNKSKVYNSLAGGILKHIDLKAIASKYKIKKERRRSSSKSKSRQSKQSSNSRNSRNIASPGLVPISRVSKKNIMHNSMKEMKLSANASKLLY